MKKTGDGLAKFIQTKIGTPYVYGAKGKVLTRKQLDYLAKTYPDMYTEKYYKKSEKAVGKVAVDCSGLMCWYMGVQRGSAQLYATATKRGLIKDVDKAPIGAVLWQSGHVGGTIGQSKLVEARGVDYGVVETEILKRRFTHWLLFEDIMSYDYDETSVMTFGRLDNPYTEPFVIVRFGDKGDAVRWLQWELIESGYATVKVDGVNKALKVDGTFGTITDIAVKLYQKSCKIKVDGKVGEVTRKFLKNDLGL